MVKSAIVPLAEGFEEIEAVTIIDVLRRGMVNVVTASIGTSLTVKGAHNIELQADVMLQGYDTSQFDFYVLPGGMPGSTNLKEDEAVLSMLQEAHASGKICAAICAAPIVLARAGIITNATVTSYPGFRQELGEVEYLEEPVVVDKNIITARGPGAAIPFALKLVEIASDSETAMKLGESMQVYWM
jgi:protein deglycase